jgi:hypothetical protein
MGVVYSAEDSKLGRKVALKFLSTKYSSDPIALHRFEREARAASALNHPNICTIYEIDEHEGHRFIAMELLKGVTLRDRIAGEPMKRADLLDYAIQITNGLEAAHAEGILHRDVKPANIFVTAQGFVKILDFGLAKLTGETTKAAAAAASTVPLNVIVDEQVTTPGVPMGTVAYMSPEQARGEQLDARTDLFSFGAVLYEMATGRHAFTGNTSEGVVDAILHKNPLPIVRFNPDIAPDLQSIINKALEKDRKLRYQTASDLRADLQRVKRDSDPSRVAAEEILAHAPDAWVAGTHGTAVMPSPRAKEEIRVEKKRPARTGRLSRSAGEKAAPDRVRARVVGSIALAIILAIAGVIRWRTTRGDAEDAFLNVQTEPGAQVLVDDRMVGTTASNGTISAKVSPGTHRVEVRLTGYDSWVGNVSVKPGDRMPIAVYIEPTQHRLPDLGGPPSGTLVAQLRPIQHPAAPAESASASALLRPPGTLVARSNVAGADVFVDGQLKGVTGRDKTLTLKLQPGTHKLQLRKPFYKNSPIQEIEIAAAQEQEATLTLRDDLDRTLGVYAPPSDAYLIIQSSPGAEIRVDGRAAGKVDGSGVLSAKVAPGRHQVQASLDGYEPWSINETVKPGDRMRLQAALRPMVEESAPPAAGSADAAAIKELVYKFSVAYGDCSELRSLWPSLTVGQCRLMEDSTRTLKQTRVKDNCPGSPSINGERAEWTCTESMTYLVEHPETGESPRKSTIPIQVTFRFKKNNGIWYVDGRSMK